MKPFSNGQIVHTLGKLAMIEKTMGLLETDRQGDQINVAPQRSGALWKVVISGIKCPNCGSQHNKARTGKRVNSQGLLEHYRACEECGIRFRVIYE